MLAQLMPLTAGKVDVCRGRPLCSKSETSPSPWGHRRSSIVLEGVTVREYLTLGKPDRDPEPAVRQVELDPARYLNRRLDKALSGGERPRIELASVLSMQPQEI